MDAPFGAIVTAAVTPFGADGTVNHDALRVLLRHLVSHGSDAVVVCGTTGESPTLTHDEQLAVIRTAVDELAGRAPVIAGTGSNCTAHAIEMTREAVRAGVDGVLVVTPYYNKPPREGLVRHFTQVARAAGDTPVILYNIPARVVINLDPSLIVELAAIDNVVALKQANPDLAETSEIAARAPELAIYAGDDTSLMPMLPLGAVGGICVASHLVGDRMGQLVQAWKAGDAERAALLDQQLQDVYETLAISTNPIPIKAAMAELGFDVGEPRLPLCDVTGMQRARIRSMLERQQLLGDSVVSR